MATFKIQPLLKNENREGLIPVAIRITHKRVYKYIPTPYSVTRKQLGKDGEVKDPSMKKKINVLWVQVKDILDGLSFRVSAYTPDELKEYIRRELEGDSQELDFFAFAEHYLASIRDTQPATALNHQVALNNLKRYLNSKPLILTDITERFLNGYLSWMRVEGGVLQGKKGEKLKLVPLGSRGQSLYLGSIKKLFGEALKAYNDYDRGDIPIPNRPFDRFKIPKAKAQKTSEDKALTIEQVKAIRDYEPKNLRDELARDCFMLSFYLCGMNSIDLYSCIKINKDILTYNRSKTFDRRMDNAEVRVRIESEAEALYNKYKGKKTVFSFSETYANRSNFNGSLNKGLKKLGKELGINSLTFYYARHSWASLASNECNIPIEVVGMALGHSDSKVITNIYIKKDWGKVFEANRKVLNLLR